MKQYRITSANFVAPGESLDPDAFMEADQLSQLKKLAGLGDDLLEDYYTAGGHDPAMTALDDTNVNQQSPVGSVANLRDDEKRQIEREKNIKTGTPEWFRLWFSRPELTGEKPIGDAPAPRKPNPAAKLD